MTAFVLSAGVLCLLSLALLSRPWWRRGGSGGLTTTAATQPDVQRKTPSATLLLSLGAVVLAIAGVGYRLVGSPTRVDASVASAAASSASAADALPGPEQVNAMVDELAKRLASQPNDAPGWARLARSYVVLHRYDEAVKAYKTASELMPNDATLLADRAFAVAMANHRQLEGEPAQLLAQALSMDARNAKALALSGSAAFSRQDYPSAIRFWEALASTQPADSPIAQQVQMSLAEARRLNAMNGASAAASSAGRAAPGRPASTSAR